MPVSPDANPAQPLALMKWGKLHHLAYTQATGALHMRSLRHFQGLNDGRLRGDRDEGLSLLYQPSELGEMTIADVRIPPSELAGPLRVSMLAESELPIYSMYSVTLGAAVRAIEAGTPLIDPRCRDFGDHALVVTDMREFFKRVDQAGRRLGTGLSRRPVRYYDVEIYSGRLSPFSKNRHYEYQQEYRFILGANVGSPFDFVIGPLTDITMLVPSATVYDTIQVRPRLDKALSTDVPGLAPSH